MNTTTTLGAATRAKLMQAAARIVSRDGMAAATTAAIAAEAGVAEGTLYRHFESKDDLLIAAYRQMKQEVFLDAGDSIDISTFMKQTGFTTFDQGFVNTAATRSAITLPTPPSRSPS